MFNVIVIKKQYSSLYFKSCVFKYHNCPLYDSFLEWICLVWKYQHIQSTVNQLVDQIMMSAWCFQSKLYYNYIWYVIGQWRNIFRCQKYLPLCSQWKKLLYLLLIYYLSMKKHFSEVKMIPDPSSYGLYKHYKYYIV